MTGQEQDATFLTMVVLAFLLGVFVTVGFGVVFNVFHVGQSWDDQENRACVAFQAAAP